LDEHAIAWRFRVAEQLRAVLVAGQCRRRRQRCTSRRWATGGSGKRYPEPSGYVSVIRPEPRVSLPARGASTHRGHLEAPAGQFLPLGCQPRLSLSRAV